MNTENTTLRVSVPESNYPLLYSFRRCPFAMRARMALGVSNIVCELREILLKNKPQAMLDVSSKGTVPVLVLQNGDVLDKSRLKALSRRRDSLISGSSP